MLDYVESIGWDRVSPAQALAWRRGVSGLVFHEILTDQLGCLNRGVISLERALEVVRRLTLLPATIEGNRDALKWLRGEMSVFVEEEKRERNVRLVDFENPDNNVFHVTWEWRHKSPSFPTPNRADVVFLINGIAVAVAELKAAEKPNAAAEGVEQIRRYHRETPEMLLLPQLFEVSQMLDFFYGATWNTSRKNLLNWRDDEPGNFEKKVKAFFDRERFLRVLKEYVLFLTKDDVLSKVVLRQHQVRAVERAVERAADPVKKRGLVWHTQGSGKTLTMITIAARLLRGTIQGEKPTVLMLVDRNELETQLFQNIAAYGIGTVTVAKSKRELQDLLKNDTRGLIVSMIHKFDDIPAKLNERSSVVVLVDEAHRTTGGDLGTYLMAALPQATYLGFTGTPIDKLGHGKGTFKVFGADDPQGYLDKYSIAASIEDGTTVELHYALAPSDLRVERETLEKQFLALAGAEGVADVEELNAVLDRAVKLKEAMKAKTRVAKIGKAVAEHFRENVEPMGFKAFLVAVDREACALYKAELDKYLPVEWSRVVISPGPNDGPQLKQHYLDETSEKEVRKAFTRRDKLPQILIVTEKLLTGFDAPILYALYLDKPMRDHVLLQTIARVNRPYEDEDGRTKPCGFVLDFVGIFERLEQALSFDSDIVASVIQNIDVLKDLFTRMMADHAPSYLAHARGWTDREKEAAIAHFEDKERREAFFKFYKQMSNVYEILSPDAALRGHIEDYQALTMLFALIRNAYGLRVYVDKEVTAKTRALLRDATTSGKIDLPNKIHTLGAAELAALKTADNYDTTKVLNLRKALAGTVAAEGAAKPYLVSIAERAEKLEQAYEDRQLTTQQTLLAFEQLATQYVEADAERASMGVDENTYAVFSVLRPLAPEVTAGQAMAIDALFAEYPDYAWDSEQGRQLRAALYRLLRPLVGSKMTDVASTLLKLQRV